MLERIYTVKELAEAWPLSKRAIYAEIAAGRLNGKPRRGTERPLLIRESEANRWAEENL